jgi:phage-related minor tail protein
MLFLQLAAAADTVLVRQVPPVRTAFEQLVFVASGLTSILTLLVGMRQAAIALQAKLDEVLTELRPLTQNANAASQDLRDATAMAKAMVAESQETVSLANARVRDTVDDLAERVAELTEIVGKVTRMASRIAGVAATAIGGLKAGAKVLGFGRKKSKPSPRVRKPERDADEKPRLRRRR